MALPLSPGTWNLDAVHSQIGFSTKHLGIATIRGTFDSFEGALVVGDDLSSSTLSATIQMDSVNSGFGMRDGHFKSDAFFDVESHPTMTFTSSAIDGDGDRYTVTGDLTVRGVTKPVSLDVAFGGTAVFPPTGADKAGFWATTEIKQSDFGITHSPFGSDEVTIEISAELDRAAEAEASEAAAAE